MDEENGMSAEASSTSTHDGSLFLASAGPDFIPVEIQAMDALQALIWSTDQSYVLRTAGAIYMELVDDEDDDGIEQLILPIPSLLVPPGPVFRVVAAPAEVPLNLEKMKYGEAAGEGMSGDCAICIEEYKAGDDLTVVPCAGNHRFHEACLAAWMARKLSCPLCRHPLSS